VTQVLISTHKPVSLSKDNKTSMLKDKSHKSY